MHLNITITLDNIPAEANVNDIADQIENMVASYTNLKTDVSIYDNDGVATSNPIMLHTTMKRVKR